MVVFLGGERGDYVTLQGQLPSDQLVYFAGTMAFPVRSCFW